MGNVRYISVDKKSKATRNIAQREIVQIEKRSKRVRVNFFTKLILLFRRFHSTTTGVCGHRRRKKNTNISRTTTDRELPHSNIFQDILLHSKALHHIPTKLCR